MMVKCLDSLITVVIFSNKLLVKLQLLKTITTEGVSTRTPTIVGNINQALTHVLYDGVTINSAMINAQHMIYLIPMLSTTAAELVHMVVNYTPH